MNISFDRSFYKRLVKIRDKTILNKVKEIIEEVQSADRVGDISNIKKMEGFKTFYRIRVGDYRIGLELQKDTLSFITIAHRKDIYKTFPK